MKVRAANFTFPLCRLSPPDFYFARSSRISITFKARSQDRLQMKGFRARLIEGATLYRFLDRVYFIDSVRQPWKSQVQPKNGQEGTVRHWRIIQATFRRCRHTW